MKWQKEKPDFKDECLVICANKIKPKNYEWKS